MGNCACGEKAAVGQPKQQLEPGGNKMAMGSTPSEAVNRGMFIRSSSGSIQDVYNMDKKKLGEGSYGSVCRGKHLATGDERAIKKISKKRMHNMDRLQQEIAIMKLMDHPNIIKLFETYEDKHFIYLVMEICTGGELFDCIIEAGHFSEREAAALMQQVFRAIFYMHQHRPKGVCHRDLKPENFLFATKEQISKNVLKLIDFGLSTFVEPGKNMKTMAGTPYYVAPEVLAGSYNERCDSWSAGVIMYTLLSGYPPFHGRNDKEVLAKVRRGSFDFPSKEWRHISFDAKGLISELLKFRPQERCCAQRALNHNWIRHKAPGAKDMPLAQGFVSKLGKFRSQNRFKKAVLQIIAGQLNDDQIKELRETFTAMDVNGDGLLTLEELKTGLSRAGLSALPSDLEKIMDGIDADGSGEIDYTEFLAATIDRRSYMREDVCWTAFNVFDLNHDGKISQEELRLVLQNEDVEAILGVQEAEELMGHVDTNGDGNIDFDEFMAMMRDSAESTKSLFLRAKGGGA
jgi:calcium-dependent protein kinase